MRKTILFTFVILMLLNLTADAQIAKGSIFLGGGITYGNAKDEQVSNSGTITVNQSAKGITINPAIGFASKENLIIGLELTFTHANQDYTQSGGSNYTQKINKVGGGPFIRKYVPIAKSFYFFGQGGLGYLHENQEQNEFSNPTQTTTTKLNGSTVYLNLYPGVAYGFTKSFYMELGLNNLLNVMYQNNKSTTTTSYSAYPTTHNERGFVFSTGLNNTSQFSIGARFILGNK